MRHVEATILIQAPTDRVLDAFLELSMLQDWWGVERALVEKREGGVYTLAWQTSEAGFHYVSTGIIERYVPGRELHIGHLVYLNPERPLLGPMDFWVRTEEVDGGTQLTIRQDGYGHGPDWDWYYNVVREAWPGVLQVVKVYLEKTPASQLTEL